MIKALLYTRIKAMFAGMFSRSKKGTKGGIGTKILVGILIVYLAACFLGLFGMIFAVMCEPFVQSGFGWLYFALEFLFAFMLCFIGSIFATQTQIFDAKDNELLLSMPIKPSAILASRIVALLLINYVLTFVIAIPAGVVWCASQPITAIGVIFYIISVLLLPLLGLAMSCLFGWIIALITSRMRRKNIVTLVLSLAFFVVYFWFCGNMNRYMEELVSNGEAIARAIEKSIFPAYHMGKAITEGNVLSMLIFVLCTVIPFLIVYFILSKAFVGIATANRGAKKIKYKEQALKVSGIRTAFRKKELRHYYSNAMYILNATTGAVFMIILAVLLLVKQDVIITITLLLRQADINVSMASIMCLGLTLSAAMNMISAPSISLEGKSLWIAQSLPVRAKDVLLAKVEMHCMVCLPIVIIAAAISDIALKPDIIDAVMMFLLPGAFTIMMGYLGVVLNLKFPRFDWISETHVVKQGMSVILAMFGAIAGVLMLTVLYIVVLHDKITLNVYFIICTVFFALLAGVMHTYLVTKGAKKFEKL